MQLALQFPLDAAPPKVRRHGLSDAHSRPLAGRRTKRGFSSWRTSPALAWGKPYLELNAANSFPSIILDCDDQEAFTEAWIRGGLPSPNWIVGSKTSGHLHAVWNLARPVHRYPEARPGPLRFYRRVAEFYAAACRADPGFAGVLTRNPMSGADRTTRTTWPARDPYHLETLAQVIPLGWRAPKIAATGAGRNVDMFLALMRWAGRIENREIAVLAAAEAMQADFVADGRGRLPISEVRATVASVEKYRARWEAQGWHRPDWIERQRARQRRQVEARRAKTAERDAAIHADRAAGMTLRALAAKYGLSAEGVRKILARGVSTLPTQIVRPEAAQSALAL